jgi:hypothetical protein
MLLPELSNSNAEELTPDRYAKRILVRNLDENGQSGQLPVKLQRPVRDTVCSHSALGMWPQVVHQSKTTS